MYRCIGQSASKGRCTNERETPSNPDRPEWGFLCSECANAPANRNSPMASMRHAEPVNVGAMQADIQEYKDQTESGFMRGMQGADYEDENL